MGLLRENREELINMITDRIANRPFATEPPDLIELKLQEARKKLLHPIIKEMVRLVHG